MSDCEHTATGEGRCAACEAAARAAGDAIVERMRGRPCHHLTSDQVVALAMGAAQQGRLVERRGILFILRGLQRSLDGKVFRGDAGDLFKTLADKIEAWPRDGEIRDPNDKGDL